MPINFKYFKFVIFILFGVCFFASPQNVLAANTFTCRFNPNNQMCTPNALGDTCQTGYSIDPNVCLPLSSGNCASTHDCVAGPQPTYNPTYYSSNCTDTNDPEFHSLRPYPGSTCVTETVPLAKFCGNTLTLQEVLPTRTYDPNDPNCKTVGNKATCSYTEIVAPHTITIDLSDAKLPIMGNTENVPNSTTSTGDSPTLSDTDKVNGYVSWYLNGVMNRAEDGNSKNDENNYNIVNLSGPINKLLPQTILEAQRIQTVNNVSANTNHNQITVCGNYDGPRVFSLLQLVTGLGHVTPTECYPAGNGTQKAQGDIVLRLKPTVCVGQLCTDNGWGGDLSLFNLVQGSLTAVTKQVVNLVSPILAPFVDSSLKSPWNQKVPPLPWGNDPEGVPFTELTYRKSYNEWTGKTCVVAPVLNILVCFDNLLIPNKYADLFPYIPLSSTEDITGNIQVDPTSVGGPGITNVTFSNQTPFTLFFPHLIESDQLGSTLQDTYISKDQQKDQKTGPDTAVAPPSSCTTVDVRSNPGDKLFFATSLSGKLGYTASFTCDFNPPTCSGQPTNRSGVFCKLEFSGICAPSNWTCSTTIGPQDCPTGYKCGLGCSCNNTPQTCSKTVSISLSTSSNTPKIDDIWSRLVAGPTAVVKRMFPKLGTEIGTLKDIPGSTAVTYTGAQAPSAELNFPHIGGISEYFLKGIQTMLRPKGYGEPISFGPTTNNPPSGNVDCDQSAPDITLPNTIGKEALHQLAIQWEGGKEGNHVLECYNDVARKSLAAGISPAFTFLMWINESGGSNYNISNQDWGINSSQITGLTAQLERFLQLPSAYKNNYPQCFGKTKTNTEVYFDLFAVGLQAGQCVPGAGQPYIDLFNGGWNWFTTCPMANYPFGSSCY